MKNKFATRFLFPVCMSLLLISSIIQILPDDVKVIQEASASSCWFETEWSTPSNYTDSLDVDTRSSTGNVRLIYGQWLYIPDRLNCRIVKTMINGSGWTTYGTQGFGKGQFFYPSGICYDEYSGYIYVTDGSRIVKTKIDGTGWSTYGTQGTGTGQFLGGIGIDYDVNTGYIYIVDSGNNRIVKTKMDGSGWTTLGTGGNGVGQFRGPFGINFDSSSDYIYVVDSGNGRIVKTKMNGSGWTTYGSFGFGTGKFFQPVGIYFDNTSGYIYVADSGNNRIVKTKMNGSGWTILGTKGTGTGQFQSPSDIYYDKESEHLYVVDSMNYRIVKTKMDGNGWTTYGSLGNGTGQFYNPFGIAITKLGYCREGYLSSKYYDCGGPTGLKTLSWTAITPPGTSIKFQLRTVNESSNLTSKDFVGPDGTNCTYYISSGATIWSGHHGDRWVQYRVNLSTTNLSQTPVLKDVTIIYNLLPTLPILVAPANNTWTSDNTPEFIWDFVDSDSDSQGGFQWQATSDNKFDYIDYDSERRISTKSSFTPSTIISDGIWYWRIRTKDSDGDWGPFSSPWKLTIDSTPPNSTIKVVINNGFYRGVDSISGIASDPPLGIGINSVEVVIGCLNNNTYWNGSNWVSVESWLLASGTAEWALNSSSVIWASGSQYSIRSRATDKLFNIEIPGSGKMITIDTIPPSSTIEYPMDNSYLNSLEMISGSSFDMDGAGIAKVELTIKQTRNDKYWNGIAWDQKETWLLAYGTNNWVYYLSLVSWTSATQYIISSRATDNVSNIEVPSSGSKFIFDTDKPSSIIEFPMNDSYLNKLDSIIGRAEDVGGSGIDNVEISIRRNSDYSYWDGFTWSSDINWLAAAGKSNWSYDASNIQLAADTYYTVRSSPTDNAGNKKISWLGNTFMYDDRPPEQLSISINDDAEFTNSASIELLLSAEDSGSGVSGMAFGADGAQWSAWEPFDPERSFTLPPNDGDKTIYFRVQDRAGNMAEPVFDSIILDTKPPDDLSILINDGAEFTTSTSVKLDLSGNDSVSGIKDMAFSHDGDFWLPWEPFNNSKNIPIFTGDGNKRIYFKLRDNAGNIAEPIFNSIILDSTPPYSLSILINNNATEINSTQVTLKLNALDNTSGVNVISLSIDGKNWSAWEEFVDMRSYILPSGDGIKTIYFRVMDHAGNIAEPVMASILLNTTSPEPEVQAPEKAKPSFNFSRSFTLLLIIFTIIIILILVVLKTKRKKRSKRELPTGKVDTVKPIVAPTLDKLKGETTAKPTLAQPARGTATTTPQLASPKTVGQTPVPQQIPQPTLAPKLPPAQKKITVPED